MTCHFGDGIILCDGQSGEGWRVTYALCPWCCVRGDKPVRVLEVVIFSGYGGSDFKCGACGQFWSNDGEITYRAMSNEERDANIATVAAVPDPKCWDCHDTGDKSRPWDDSGIACACGAAPSEETKG